jgi:hypothetical protein
MSISIPLMKQQKHKKADGLAKGVQGDEVTAYDIILGNAMVDLEKDDIPFYLKILDDYEKLCSKEARYIEAQMSKHKKDELKKKAKQFKKEKAMNAHLKEKIDVEEAYLKEFNEFQLKWERKLKKFDEKVEESRVEMLEHQKEQLKEHLNKIEEKFAVKMKETNLRILNMQKVEKTLAKQREYIKAQEKREEWQKEQENLAIQQRMEVDKKKNELMNKYEIRNKKEINEFVTKINEMRVNLENERKKELDSLMTKYDRIKNQLKSIQKSEDKRLNNIEQYKVTDADQTLLHDTKSFISRADVNESYIQSKKKVIMHKIKRLNLQKKL